MKVIELLRVSTTAQGVDMQKAANRRTSQRFGLEIIDTVALEGVSGAAVLQEPSFQKLLEDIGRREVDGVVTYDASRLMRPENWADYAILQRFAETNTKIYTESEGEIDLTTDAGKLMGGINVVISGVERRKIRKRMMDGKQDKRRKGFWVAGERPYGVGYPNRLERANGAAPRFSYIYPEADRVREAFRRALAGDLNYESLGKHLGVVPTSAKLILKHPIYKGWFGEHKVIDPGLVTEEDWDKVQEIIARKQALDLRQRTHVGEFVYNGYLWCSRCGARIHTIHPKQYYYYFCSKKKERFANGTPCTTRMMERDRLEALLDQRLSRTLTSPKLLQEIHDRYRQQLEARAPNGERERLVQTYKALYAKRDRTIENFEDGVISKEQRTEKLRTLDQEIARIHEKLTVSNPTPSWTPSQLVELFRPFTTWVDLDREAKRRVLNGLALRIHIADYDIKGIHVDKVGVNPKLNGNYNFLCKQISTT